MKLSFRTDFLPIVVLGGQGDLGAPGGTGVPCGSGGQFRWSRSIRGGQDGKGRCHLRFSGIRPLRGYPPPPPS